MLCSAIINSENLNVMQGIFGEGSSDKPSASEPSRREPTNGSQGRLQSWCLGKTLKTLRSEVRTLKVWRTGEKQRVASGLVGE